MNKMLPLLIVIIILLLVVASFTGLLPLSVVADTTTDNYEHGGVDGWGELIGPNSRQGFITSWKPNKLSETVTCMGHVKVEWTDSLEVQKYRYRVRGKQLTGDWEVLSIPGETSRYLSNPNPGEIAVPGGITWEGVVPFESYSFEMVGRDYKAIQVWFDIYCKTGLFDSFKWRTFQVDEAYLYEGYGGLYLPTGIEDGVERPYSTFEIGQQVRIRVETSKGGQTVDGTGSWRVTLNEPYTGEVDDPDVGGSGGVIKEKLYDDDSIGYFTFTVTEEMAAVSMSCSDPFSVRIWNTILPMGTLDVDFIDFIAKAPGTIDFNGPNQIKVGETANIELSAVVNAETQAPIEVFRVSVIYGEYTALLPSDPHSPNWLMHTRLIDAIPSGNKYTVGFSVTPQRGGFISIHAKAQDNQGRWSAITEVWTFWCGDPLPEDVIDDKTGQHDYGGGHTDDWLPWDPSGGNWEETIFDYLGVILAVVIFFFALLIALLPQIPIPGGTIGRMIVVLLGLLAAAAAYLFI